MVDITILSIRVLDPSAKNYGGIMPPALYVGPPLQNE